jgi:predicted O-linked N-acetylglucosamine transferase (SPINDLY family)
MPDIAPERLIFSVATSHPEHMQCYQQADLILDPYPHSGGVVCLEQLYMGVPMVTLYGTQASGRTSSSVLTAMGKTDWIARTPNEYVEKAITMTSNIQKLNAIRKTLQQEFLESPVVKGYAEHVEQAYRAMWRRWCQK